MEVKLFESIEEAHQVLVENQPRLVKANDRNICVVRIEDRIIAFYNECPHLGADLHLGQINYLGQIVCPLHAYRFETKNGDPIERDCDSLHMIPLKINEAGLYLLL